MNIVYSITPNLGRLAGNLKDAGIGSLRAGMINLLTTVEALAVKDAPKRTTNLARSRTSNVNADGSRGVLTFIAPYAAFVHEGTGLFGPHHQRIVPTTKRALFWPGARHPVRSTAGMKGRPWVRQAANEVNAADAYQEGMQNYLHLKGF
jgi:hypothetical protein